MMAAALEVACVAKLQGKLGKNAASPQEGPVDVPQPLIHWYSPEQIDSNIWSVELSTLFYHLDVETLDLDHAFLQHRFGVR